MTATTRDDERMARPGSTPGATSAATPEVADGLEGVVAAATRLSRVEGEAGRLTLGGYAVEELAPRASFEEVVFLLWNDRLPDAAELADLRRKLARHRALPAPVVDLLRHAARHRVAPMDALRMGVAALDVEGTAGADGGSEGTPTADGRLPAARRAAARLVAAVPSLVAAYHRLLAGEEPVSAGELGDDPERELAAVFLHQLFAVPPSAERVRALTTYLNTVSDHGFNASTFTARVVISTGSDPVSAVAAAVGALKGPLHGGAPGPALDAVLEVGSTWDEGAAARAETLLRRRLDRGERLMGFGHRVYRVRDPRADVLAAAAEALFLDGGGDEGLYRLARTVESVALRLLRERKPERRLDTNVEFYTALLLHGLGLPSALFTPTFAVGRVAGWTAHALEQIATGRLIRPAAAYVGATGRRWRPVAER